MKYRKGYKYQLAEDYFFFPDIPIKKPIAMKFIKSRVKPCILIKYGYAWDGATGIPDTRKNRRGSLEHDALTQLIREGYIDPKHWDKANRQLQRTCREDGVSRIVAWIMYKGVTKLGKNSIKPRKNEVKEAP